MATAIEGLVKSIGGQVQLSSPLGVLLQKIVTGLSGVISSGGAAPQYYEAKNLILQHIAGPTNFKFDTVIAARGITQPDAETIQLTPGKTYHLSFHGHAVNFGSVNDNLNFRWVDGNLNNIPQTMGDAIQGLMLPQTSTQASSVDQVVDCIYTAPNDPNQSVVHVRVTQVTGSADIPAGGMQLTVIEIPG